MRETIDLLTKRGHTRSDFKRYRDHATFERDDSVGVVAARDGQMTAQRRTEWGCHTIGPACGCQLFARAPQRNRVAQLSTEQATKIDAQ